MFSTEFKSEWSRLTPRYRHANDDLREVIVHTWQETWRAYFAPLWMLVWLVRYPFKTEGQSHGK